jgi:hypothetical protein
MIVAHSARLKLNPRGRSKVRSPPKLSKIVLLIACSAFSSIRAECAQEVHCPYFPEGELNCFGGLNALNLCFVQILMDNSYFYFSLIGGFHFICVFIARVKQNSFLHDSRYQLFAYLRDCGFYFSFYFVH